MATIVLIYIPVKLFWMKGKIEGRKGCGEPIRAIVMGLITPFLSRRNVKRNKLLLSCNRRRLNPSHHRECPRPSLIIFFLGELLFLTVEKRTLRSLLRIAAKHSFLPSPERPTFFLYSDP